MQAITTTGLTKRYDNTLAVNDLDLQVRSGEVYGFVGPNGAGKSTTIAILLGLRRPTHGAVEVLGKSPVHDEVDLRRRIGSLPENGGLLDRLSGEHHLAFLIGALDSQEHPSDLFIRVGLSEEDARRPVKTYSTGMAQRLRLALALVGRPELLLLDEPASGLDPEGIDRLRHIVQEERERGATVFFSSHHLDDVAAICDRVGFLVDGRLREVVADDISRDSLSDRFSELVREGQ